MAAALLLSISALGVCAISALMDARAEVPGQPKTSDYLDVQDVPRPAKPAMTVDEQSKLKNDLSAARDRQTTDGKSKGKAPAKP